MALQAGDALTTHNFALQIDGVTIEYLQSVGEMTDNQDAIEWQEVTPAGKTVTRKLPGATKGGTVTVTRGATQSQAFSQWIKSAKDGNMSAARKNATIIYQDTQGQPVKRINLTNAWCQNITIAGVSADNASVLTEQVTIIYEELAWA